MIPHPTCLSLDSAEETTRLGTALASALFPGLLVCLRGNLGAGKSTLAQGIGRGLGLRRMASPSFVLLREYPTSPPLVHGDLYRLQEEEIPSLHLDEYLSQGYVVLLEWAERFQATVFPDRWDLCLETPFLDDPDQPFDRRILRAWGHSAASLSSLERGIHRFTSQEQERKGQR